MKKKIVSLLTVLVLAFSAVFALTACGNGDGGNNKPVDYAEGLTPSQGLVIKHISELGDGEFSYFTYIDSEDYYVVTDLGTCTDDTIVVPSTYQGKPVMAIGDSAFSSNKKPTEFSTVILPNSVTVIGKMGLRVDKAVTVKGNGVKVYGDGCFRGNAAKNFVLSQSATHIFNLSLSLNKSAETVWIPKTVTNITAAAFQDSTYKTIKYEGSEADWKKIEFSAGEFDFTDATIQYNVAYPGFN